MERDLRAEFADLNTDVALQLINSKIQGGDDPLNILQECQQGMRTIMERYESMQYSLDSVVASFDLFRSAKATLKPLLPKDVHRSIGKVVIGTVQYDIHSIGKDLAAELLELIGFEVFNLGVDVPPKEFVDELERTGAPILGLSGLVSSCFDSMKETVMAVRKAGLKPKIVIGGGITDESLRKYVEADAHTQNMVEGARICLGFAKSKG
jgi:methanogenic corrinoid protein MtbC1